MVLDKRKRGKKYRTYQPCYALLNHFESVVGAHFRELAVCEFGVQELWGREELGRILPPEKVIGMSEQELCNKIKLRLRAVGWSVVECEVSYAIRKECDT